MPLKTNSAKYNDLLPVVSLHVPKSAGSSFHNALFSATQYGYKVISYYPDVGYSLPSDWNSPRTIIHGHFIRRLGQGVEKICPDVNQFIAVVRDPFDICVSAYYYGLSMGFEWAKTLDIDGFLHWWLEQDEGPLLGSLPPIEESERIDEYTRKFLHIGLASNLSEFVKEIEPTFGVRFGELPFLNSSLSAKSCPDLRRDFRRKHWRDYELYDFVRTDGNTIR
ncbi:hypothetical protein [Sulfuritalea sp.]|jgi:hypothetical protein|uniref:hypothetical protein n=1 Tax=Sulfuritalea sp. TaxID=2480090 RepID=UPI001AC057B3|nr:hypothetical protein [Sulfuritalea sp.]MBN8474948.1 hypothetical protein [Sulfuritalea sp.]